VSGRRKNAALVVIVLLAAATPAIAGFVPDSPLCPEACGWQLLSDIEACRQAWPVHFDGAIHATAVDNSALCSQLPHFLDFVPFKSCAFGPGREDVARYFCRSPGR